MGSSKRKKERKHLRYIKNVEKEKEYKAQAWESGRLIEENHNGKEYSPEYARLLLGRLIEILYDLMIKSTGNEDYVTGFRMYKRKIIDLILLWPSSKLDSGLSEYQYVKALLETYWDCPENLFNTAKNLWNGK